VHLCLALMTYLEPIKPVEPTGHALYDPVVAAQPFDAVLYAALPERGTQGLTIVAFVRMNFDGPTLERDRVNRLDDHLAVCGVGRRVQDRQREAVLVYKMALRAR